MAIKWKDNCDVFFLTTAHEEVLVEAPLSRGAHHKIKPAAVLDYNKYKTGVDRSDQVLSHYSCERETITRGMSGYWAHQWVADSRGPVFVAGLSLK